MANHLGSQEGLRTEEGRVPFPGKQLQGGGHIRDTHQITEVHAPSGRIARHGVHQGHRVNQNNELLKNEKL